MHKVIKLILVLVMCLTCKAQSLEDLSVSDFLEKLRSEKNYHKKVNKDLFFKFYEKNKVEIWGQDGQRGLWKELVPFLKRYNNNDVIKSLLKDIGLAQYSEGTLFGWTPLVMASTRSKMYHVIELLHSTNDTKGVTEYYHYLKKRILEKKNNISPVNYSVLTGLICSLPDVENNDEKIELSNIVIDYFNFMSSRFLKHEKSLVDSSINGFREGLLTYYFYETSNKFKGYDLSSYWPNEKNSFNIRKYFDFLKVESKRRELSNEERKIVNQVQKIITNLAKSK